MFRFEGLQIWKLALEYGNELYNIADKFPSMLYFAKMRKYISEERRGDKLIGQPVRARVSMFMDIERAQKGVHIYSWPGAMKNRPNRSQEYLTRTLEVGSSLIRTLSLEGFTLKGIGCKTLFVLGMRGGSWNNESTNLRVSDRNNAGWTNTDRNNNVGFRPARTPCPVRKRSLTGRAGCHPINGEFSVAR